MKPIEISDQNFDLQVREGTTLVDFWAPWCGPCRLLSPVIDQLAAEYEGRVKVAKINVDQNPMTQGRYRVMSIPTLIIFENGVPVQTVSGLQPKRSLEKLLNQVLEG